jgi:hypothetical protein
MLICMREINAHIWLGKSCCVIWMIQIMSSNIIILLDDKLIMRVWSIRALNRREILWLVLEPCKIECLWSQSSSLQLPISITPVATSSRENDGTGRTQQHSLRTGNELWTLDHILVLAWQKREEAKKSCKYQHPIQIHGCILGSLQLVDIYDRDQDTVFWNSFPSIYPR